jgi:predicted O-methyltransferase YrrM
MRTFLQRRIKSRTPVKIYSPGELVARSQASKSGWAELYYGNVESLIRLISANSVIECGVALGGHANDLLTNLSTISYTGVDPYQHGYDNSDSFVSEVEASLGMTGQIAMDSLFEAVRDSLELFGDRAHLVRQDSIKYSQSLENGTVDLVFLDDNHTHEYVSNELASWWPKVRSGGILCGDDYWMPSVKSAVESFAASNGLPLRFIAKNQYNTYFFQK